MATALDKTLFNMKFTSKQLSREGTKAEKKMKEEEKKISEARKKGDHASARIHAENFIRAKNESLNFLRIASRIDGVAARVETAVRMNALSKQIGSVVSGMDTVLGSMDPSRISAMMDKFERQFETLDVSSNAMERSMASSTATSIPEDDVDAVIKMVDEQYGLEMRDTMDGARAGSAPIGVGGAAAASSAPARVAAAVAAGAPAAAGAPPPGPGDAPPPAPPSGGGSGGGADIADLLAARMAALRK